MPRKIFNDGEEIVFGDMNDLQALVEKEFNDDVLRRLFQEEDGFIGVGLAVTFVNATQVDIQPGRGFITDLTVTSTEPTYRGIDVDIATAVALDAADPTDPRIDIIVVKSKRDTTVSENRDFKNATTLVISSVLFDKQDKYGAEVTYIVGTPAASPSAPAVPAGTLQLCEISIPAGTGPTSQSNITDKRNTLAIAANVGVDINTLAYTRLPTKTANTPIQTVTTEIDAELQIDEDRLDTHENAANPAEGAALIGLKVATPGDWDVEPIQVKAAADELAGRVKVVETSALVGTYVEESFCNYVVPAKSANGAGNTDLTDTAATNPRGQKYAELQTQHGMEIIHMMKIQRTGGYDSAGLPEFEVIAPKRDKRIRLYGKGWFSKVAEGGVAVKTANPGDYILVTGVYDGIGLVVNQILVGSNDIDILVDGVDTGVNLSARGHNGAPAVGDGYSQAAIISDASLTALGYGLHTTKIVNQSTDASVDLPFFGIVLISTDINEQAGNVFIKNQLLNFNQATGVAAPTVNALKGSRVVRYIDPADDTKKWAVRDAKDIQTTAASISSGAGSFTVAVADDLVADDVLLIDDGTNQELVVVSSANPTTDVVTLKSNTVNAYTSAVVSLWCRGLGAVDHAAFDEEELQCFYWREFGYTDVLSWTRLEETIAADKHGVLQDGIHSLSTNGGAGPVAIFYNGSTINPEGFEPSLTSQTTFTFFGTGLDILVSVGPSAGTNMEVLIDDSPVSVADLVVTPLTVEWKTICAGLPLGWHKVILKKVLATDTSILSYKTYQPKLPTAVESLDKGSLLFDKLTVPTSYLYRSPSAQPTINMPSRGVCYEHPKNFSQFNNGTGGGTQDWALLLPKDRFFSSLAINCDRDDAYIERWFYGTGIEIVGSFNSVGGIWKAEVDGSLLNSANFPSAIIQANAYNFTTALWDTYAAIQKDGEKLSVSALTEGWHRIRLTNTNTQNGSSSGFFGHIEAFGVIGQSCASVDPDLSISGIMSLPVGQSLDVRKFVPQLKNPDCAGALTVKGVTGSQGATVGTPVPLNDMHGMIKVNDDMAAVTIDFSTTFRNASVVSTPIVFLVRIDGNEVHRIRPDSSTTAGNERSVSLSKTVFLGRGKHKIQIFFAVSGGGTAELPFATFRQLSAIATRCIDPGNQ